MKINSNYFNIQSCCFSKKTATLLAIASIATIAYGILAMIGSLHPTHALGLLGIIGIGGSSGVLGAGILIGGVSTAIICRRVKTHHPKGSRLSISPATPSKLSNPASIAGPKINSQSQEDRAEPLLKELALTTNSKIEKYVWFPRLKSLLKEDLAILKHLLKTHPSFQGNVNPFSIIYLAIEMGENEFISLLLESGLNPNFLLDDKPLLIHATLFRQRTIVETLLVYHADAMMEDKDGLTLLHRAARDRWCWEIELLVNHYAEKKEIDRQDNWGFTPLMTAANKGYTEFAQLLLTKGSDTNLIDKNGRDSLYQAAYSGKAELVSQMLTQNTNIDRQDKEGFTPLIVAANKGHTEVVKLLLSSGSRVDLADNMGRSSLFHAINFGKIELVALILEKDTNIDRQDKEGFTPLLIAANQGRAEIVKLLLERGSNPLILDHIHRSSLHHAALSGNEEVVQFLLKSPVKINRIDAYGNTPAMKARELGYEKLAQTLEIDLDEQQRAFLEHKLLSHRFGLDIQIQYQGRKVELATLAPLYCYTALYNAFQSTREWPKKAPSVWKDENTEALLKSLKCICATISKFHEEAYIVSLLKAYNEGEVVIIPTGSIQHSNVIILYKDYLIKGDRTLTVTTENYSKYIPGLHIYKMQSKDKLKEAITKLMLEKKNSPYVNFFHSEIDEFLGLQEIKYCKRSQQQGNVCSWSSGAKLATEGFFIAQLLKLGLTLDEACTYSDSMYKAWVEEDRLKALENYLLNVPASDVKTTVLACIYKLHVSKTKMSNNPIVKLIQKYHPQAIKLSEYVKFGSSRDRKAYAELPKKDNS